MLTTSLEPSSATEHRPGPERLLMTPGGLLTPGEVADLFRVDPKTVTRWAASGRLSCVRTPGGHRRFRAREVAALLGAPRRATGDVAKWDFYPQVRVVVEGLAVPGEADGAQAYIPATPETAHMWLREPAVRGVELVPGEGLDGERAEL